MAARQDGGLDVDEFLCDLDLLRAKHGLLALDALVMVPVDAEYHHIFRTQSGASQLHLDLVDSAARHPERIVKELPR